MSFQAILVLGLIAVLLLGAVALRLITSDGDKQDRLRLQRMQALSGGGDKEALLALLKPEAKHWAKRLPLFGDLGAKLGQAGLAMSPSKFLVICAGLTIMALSIGGLTFGLFIGLPAALAIGVLLPNVVLGQLRNKRMTALILQLPDALDLMVRGLRVGHPISVTIANVSKSMPDPIAQEFKTMAEQISHGDFLTEAFNDFATRTNQEDLDYLAVSVNIQSSTGGNLADMLGVLSKTVRDRIMMRRRIKAISSEGRLSATLLSSLPFVIYLATSFTAPNYYGSVSDDPLFMPIAIVIVGLVAANALVLRKLVTFRV